MARGDLTERQWEQLEPLLPSSQGKRGGQWRAHRPVTGGIRWVLRTGAGWADIPARYGPHQTCYDRFVRWQRDGTWERILSALQASEEAEGQIDWEVSIDSSVIRAHQHAAGAPKQAAKRGIFIHRTRRWDEAVVGSAPSST